MGWLIALGVLILLASIPLGTALRYDDGGPQAKLILGPVRLTLYPRPQRQDKRAEKTAAPQEKPEENQKASPGTAVPKTQPEQREMPQSGGSFTDFLPLVKTGLDLLGDFRRKLRVNHLELKLTLAGDDPCDLAVNYGRAWAAVGNLMPQLERVFVIKKRDVEVQCDFTASHTIVYARMELTITLGRLLALGVRYGIRGLREFLTIRKKRR